MSSIPSSFVSGSGRPATMHCAFVGAPSEDSAIGKLANKLDALLGADKVTTEWDYDKNEGGEIAFTRQSKMGTDRLQEGHGFTFNHLAPPMIVSVWTGCEPDGSQATPTPETWNTFLVRDHHVYSMEGVSGKPRQRLDGSQYMNLQSANGLEGELGTQEIPLKKTIEHITDSTGASWRIHLGGDLSDSAALISGASVAPVATGVRDGGMSQRPWMRTLEGDGTAQGPGSGNQ